MNVAKSYIFFISVILSLDISSNFILPTLTSVFAICRDLSTLLFFVFIFSKTSFSLNSSIIFGVLLFSFGLIYGISYSAYIFRFYIYFIVFQHILRNSYSLTPLFMIPAFLMFAFFFIPNQSTNQGFRFFSGNATVVALILLSLVLASRHSLFKYLSIVAIFLTGSISAIASFFISTFSDKKFLLIFVGMVFILPFILPEGETSRRLSGLSSVLHGNFSALFLILTLSARTAQFSFAIDHPGFNLATGLLPQTFVGSAGIESQILHFVSFGGILGVTNLFALVAFFVHQQKVRISPTMAVILFIMLSTIRVLESAGAVVAFAIMLNLQTIYHKRDTAKKRGSIDTYSEKGY